jgi:acyl carrier protein
VADSNETIIRREIGSLLRVDHPGDFDDIPLAELGMDSLEFFEAVMILEDDHGIVIPVAELDSTVTLRRILQLVG